MFLDYLPTRENLDDIWEKAKEAVRTLMRSFSTPGGYLDQGVMERREEAALLAWLKPFEQFVRRMLVLEAVFFAPALNAARKVSAKQKRSKPSVRDLSAEDSRDWKGVSFRLSPRRRKKRDGSKPKQPNPFALAEPANLVSTEKYALRIEALCRVIGKPDRLIKSVARKLSAENALIWKLGKRRKPQSFSVIREADDDIDYFVAKAIQQFLHYPEGVLPDTT